MLSLRHYRNIDLRMRSGQLSIATNIYNPLESSSYIPRQCWASCFSSLLTYAVFTFILFIASWKPFADSVWSVIWAPLLLIAFIEAGMLFLRSFLSPFLVRRNRIKNLKSLARFDLFGTFIHFSTGPITALLRLLVKTVALTSGISRLDVALTEKEF